MQRCAITCLLTAGHELDKSKCEDTKKCELKVGTLVLKQAQKIRFDKSLVLGSGWRVFVHMGKMISIQKMESRTERDTERKKKQSLTELQLHCWPFLIEFEMNRLIAISVSPFFPFLFLKRTRCKKSKWMKKKNPNLHGNVFTKQML